MRAKRRRRVEYLDLGAVPKPERCMVFMEAALGPLRPVAADPGAERARLEALSPHRVELEVPLGEYEAIREAVLKRLEPRREDRRCA